jgi:transcriptional regulator with XRE-family HTH domain
MFYHQPAITGAYLRAFRKAAKLTQAALADRAGVRRETVQYWERKSRVPLRYGAPAAFAKALGLPKDAGFLDHYVRAGGWGVRFLRETALDAQAEAALSRMQERQAQRLARLCVTCGAKTRAGGECRNKSEPGKRRCKFHGGKSTGAKTPEGRARIADAQRRRWAAYRAETERQERSDFTPPPFP